MPRFDPATTAHSPVQRLPILSLTGSLAMALVLALPARAEAPAGEPLCQDPRASVPPPEAPTAPEEGVQMLADQAELRQAGATNVSGRVVVKAGARTIAADAVTYYRDADVVQALEGVRYWDDRLYAHASEGEVDLAANETWLDDAHYRFLVGRGQGNARTVQLGGGLALIGQGTYSTCDPGVDDWAIEARQITLDQAADLGVGRDVTLRFQGVPVFWTPYIDFPLTGKRKSGFLPPTLGSTNNSGFEVRLPYYWNIAPERDATVGAGGLSKRGAILDGEYRYLMPAGKGDLQLEVLPYDQEYGATRGTGRFRHQQSFAESWWTNVDVAAASDATYLEDLGTDLSLSSSQFLEQRADLGTWGNGWSAFGRAQSYQTMDPDIPRVNRPYDRMPQLVAYAGTPERYEGLALGLYSELVRFAQPDRVEGSRVDLLPSVSYPMRTPATFVVPRVAVRYTAYQLDNTDPGTLGDPRPPGSPNDPDRLLPIVSVDSGAFFDRETSYGARGLVQTLEPRAYYLYVPYRNQDDIPIFDTFDYTFSFFQLFRDNRFSGADRIQDANQLTLALTTRVADELSGTELARLSVGQIQYFEDRRVQMPGVPDATSRTSDLVAELAGLVGPSWQLRTTWIWDQDQGRTDRAAFMTRYLPEPGQVLNLGYVYLRDSLDQTDVSFRWQLAPQWSAVGRWNYEVPTAQSIETFGGFEYESCCWGIRAVARRFLTGDNEYSSGVFLQFVLKGLGGFGGDTVGYLRERIPGYENYF